MPGAEPSRQPALRYGPAQLVEADIEGQPLPRPGCGGWRDGPVHQVVVDDEDVKRLRQLDAAEVEPEPVARQPQRVDLFPGAEQQRRVSGELVVREVDAVELRGAEGGRDRAGEQVADDAEVEHGERGWDGPREPVAVEADEVEVRERRRAEERRDGAVQAVVGKVHGLQHGQVGDGGGDRRRHVEREDGQLGHAAGRGVAGDALPRAARDGGVPAGEPRRVTESRLHGQQGDAVAARVAGGQDEDGEEREDGHEISRVLDGLHDDVAVVFVFEVDCWCARCFRVIDLFEPRDDVM
jgi:hypothetical protein